MDETHLNFRERIDLLYSEILINVLSITEERETL